MRAPWRRSACEQPPRTAADGALIGWAWQGGGVQSAALTAGAPSLLQVVDCGSLNGTTLNGEPISTPNRQPGRAYRLSSDDILQASPGVGAGAPPAWGSKARVGWLLAWWAAAVHPRSSPPPLPRSWARTPRYASPPFRATCSTPCSNGTARFQVRAERRRPKQSLPRLRVRPRTGPLLPCTCAVPLPSSPQWVPCPRASQCPSTASHPSPRCSHPRRVARGLRLMRMIRWPVHRPHHPHCRRSPTPPVSAPPSPLLATSSGWSAASCRARGATTRGAARAARCAWDTQGGRSNDEMMWEGGQGGGARAGVVAPLRCAVATLTLPTLLAARTSRAPSARCTALMWPWAARLPRSSACLTGTAGATRPRRRALCCRTRCPTG